MHQYIFSDGETVCFIPGKNTADRKAVSVFHDTVAVLVFLVVDKVADQKVEGLFIAGKIPEHIKNALVGAGTDLIITVDNLKIQSRRIFDPCIDRSSMSLVGLVDRPDHTGMLCFKTIGDFRCSVFRAVIHDQDLHLVPSDKKRADAVFHIRFRIIAGNSN